MLIIREMRTRQLITMQRIWWAKGSLLSLVTVRRYKKKERNQLSKLTQYDLRCTQYSQPGSSILKKEYCLRSICLNVESQLLTWVSCQLLRCETLLLKWIQKEKSIPKPRLQPWRTVPSRGTSHVIAISRQTLTRVPCNTRASETRTERMMWASPGC